LSATALPFPPLPPLLPLIPAPAAPPGLSSYEAMRQTAFAQYDVKQKALEKQKQQTSAAAQRIAASASGGHSAAAYAALAMPPPLATAQTQDLDGDATLLDSVRDAVWSGQEWDLK
jgi:hypothetical protein